MLSSPTLNDHSGWLMVEQLVALLPRAPSCLCFLLAYLTVLSLPLSFCQTIHGTPELPVTQTLLPSDIPCCPHFWLEFSWQRSFWLLRMAPYGLLGMHVLTKDSSSWALTWSWTQLMQPVFSFLDCDCNHPIVKNWTSHEHFCTVFPTVKVDTFSVKLNF